MTLKEFQNKKSFWRKRRDYYSWACCQPASSSLHEEDEKNYAKAQEMCEKFAKIEEKALTEYLKNVRM